MNPKGKSDSRPKWNDYFMTLAYVAATRSTCNRKHVGCVLVDMNHHVISTGYNGSPPGKEHCDDDNHEFSHGHCIRTVHAEANAIIQAAKSGGSVWGSVCFSTIIPCYDCAKMLITVGVVEVVFHGFYQSRYDKSDKVTEYLLEGNVMVKKLEDFDIRNVIETIQV